jgi:single-strand DNA-binding protein
MNALRNKVQLIGRLGAKPEIRELDGGKKLAKFRLATNERYKNNKGETVEKTYWHSLNAWGGLAEVIEKYTDKGSEIAVEGKLTYHQYKTREGEEKYFTQIEVSDMLLLDKKNND